MSEGHHHDHPHPPQPDIEDAPASYYQFLAQAVGDLLIEKEIIAPDELRSMIEFVDGRNPAIGARLVARAWTDQEYKAFLLEDGMAAVASLGLDPGFTILTALENTARVHNVVVCTLCSCYPRALLGRPPLWYKSREYRSRLVREPRVVLREFGTDIPDDVEVRVHDSTAELRYIVIPTRPQGTDGMSETDLAKLVSRDSMIGTALATVPSAET